VTGGTVLDGRYTAVYLFSRVLATGPPPGRRSRTKAASMRDLLRSSPPSSRAAPRPSKPQARRIFASPASAGTQECSHLRAPVDGPSPRVSDPPRPVRLGSGLRPDRASPMPASSALWVGAMSSPTRLTCTSPRADVPTALGIRRSGGDSDTFSHSSWRKRRIREGKQKQNSDRESGRLAAIVRKQRSSEDKAYCSRG